MGDLDKALQVAATIKAPGRLPPCLRLPDFWKACGMQCDELVYNTLMDGCVKAREFHCKPWNRLDKPQ